MGKTAFSTNDPLKKKAYDEKLFRSSLKETYFQKFMGESKDNLVYTKTDLEKEKGDQIQFGLRMPLSGEGVEDNQILEGNEEQLTTHNFSLTLKRYRHAVRDDGALSRQRVMFSIDQESEDAIKNWGRDKTDKVCFDAVQASPTKVFYREATAGSFASTSAIATGKSAITSATNCKISLDFITQLKTWAKTGGNRQYVPLMPITIKGKKYYVLLVHPDVLCDLKLSSEFKAAMEYAQTRGDDNPLFHDAVAVWSNVIIHEHENMNTGVDGGAGAIPWGQGVLMGKQALCFAWGKRPKTISKTFDYDSEHGFAWEVICRAAKPVFDSKDFGSIGCIFATSGVSAK